MKLLTAILCGMVGWALGALLTRNQLAQETGQLVQLERTCGPAGSDEEWPLQQPAAPRAAPPRFRAGPPLPRRAMDPAEARFRGDRRHAETRSRQLEGFLAQANLDPVVENQIRELRSWLNTEMVRVVDETQNRLQRGPQPVPERLRRLELSLATTGVLAQTARRFSELVSSEKLALAREMSFDITSQLDPQARDRWMLVLGGRSF